MIEILEASYKEKLSKGTSKIYWDVLKNYDDKIIKEVTIKCIKELKYFPKISEIIEAIEGNQKDEYELAWICLKEKIEKEGYYHSVSFPKYPAIGAVIEDMAGGWCEFIESLTENEEKWIKINFLRIYPIMKRRGIYPDRLMGRFELDNLKKGYSEEHLLKRYGMHIDGSRESRRRIKAPESKKKEKSDERKFLKKE
jgi:hypothetical protein